MNYRIITYTTKYNGKIQARPNYNWEQAEHFYEIRKNTNLSYSQISKDKKLNPEEFTSQWIQKTVKKFEKKLKEADKNA